MYIIEFIYKKLSEMRRKEAQQTLKFKDETDFQEDVCEHVFLPVDSTKKILACSKCGLVVKALEIPKNKNFFMQ